MARVLTGNRLPQATTSCTGLYRWLLFDSRASPAEQATWNSSPDLEVSLRRHHLLFRTLSRRSVSVQLAGVPTRRLYVLLCLLTLRHSMVHFSRLQEML